MLAKLVRPYSGSDYDKETIAKYLTVDEFYKVEAIRMGGYSTDIKLCGDFIYPTTGKTVTFNSVQFDFYEDDGITPIDIYNDVRYNPYMRGRSVIVGWESV